MPVQITITLNEDGNVGISAPMDNKILCYGLLEVARQIVANHKKDESRITPVTMLPPSGFPGIKS